MRAVTVGDVLKNARGSLRAVREVTLYENGDLRCVTFAIKHCTWSGRGYTIYDYTALRMLGFRPTGVTLALGSDLDAALEFDIGSTATPLDTRMLERHVTCCIAKDMA